MSRSDAGYEGIGTDQPEDDGKLVWKVELIKGWMGAGSFGAQVSLNGRSVGILVLSTEEAYECLKRKLESE